MEYRGRRAWINNSLIILNIFYFLYLEITGSSEDAMFMIQKGAMYAPYVVEEHQYYRLLTAVFMHFGINHITNNMLVLFVLGGNMERALGSVKYLIFYLLCGVGANAVSMLVELKHSILLASAGASGAIFGVIGGLLYAVMANHGKLEDLNTKQLVVMILFSLYFGFTSKGVDNTAHIAGIVIGFILAMMMYRKPRTSKTSVQEFGNQYDER